MGHGRLAALIVGAATIAVATIACRQLVGIGNDPPQGPASSVDSGAEGGFTYGHGDCATCVATNCEAQATECAGNQSCSALEGCMSAANGDPTMRAQCGVDYGLGNDGATPAFEACLAGQCATACGISCGGLAATFPPASAFGNATACQSCIETGECTSVTNCATDPACQAALRCQFSSDTLDVQQACKRLPGQGSVQTTIFVVNPPIASSCASACSWGADWSCLGKEDWPPYDLGPITFKATVYDSNGQTPIDGVTVKLCAFGNQLCNTLIEGTTGPDGTVTLPRPAAQNPAMYYLDLSSPAIVPLLAFEPFPLSEPQFFAPVTATSPMDLSLLSTFLPDGGMLDSTLGTLFVAAFDCRLAPAPGVQVSIEPKGSSTTLYQIQETYSATASATDPSGVAGFVNAPVFPTTLQITVTPLGLGRPSGQMPVFVRANGEAEIFALPTQ